MHTFDPYYVTCVIVYDCTKSIKLKFISNFIFIQKKKKERGDFGS